MSPLKKSVLRALRPIHEKFRREKIEAFLSLVAGETQHGSLLDIGGGPGINREFLPLYQKFEQVVVVNLFTQRIAETNDARLQELVADARKLPLNDGAFDWVFSNAVIEHVGDYHDQTRFANEVRRVATKGYFVACPNKYFPPTEGSALLSGLCNGVRRNQPAGEGATAEALPGSKRPLRGFPNNRQQHCGLLQAGKN
jgi:ubiquinone/menaquinone biosynthesis C-methylase UbiE